MKCAFTYEHYFEILEHLRGVGYVPGFYGDSGTLYLRHDVDISVDTAFEMAEQEAKHGIQSTYFVMMSSPFYNVFEARTGEKVREIMKLGHEIGLHYDSDSVVGLDTQHKMLEIALRSAVTKFYAPHRVTATGKTGSSINLTNVFLDYGKHYISDSNGRWRSGCPCMMTDVSEYLQLATHPFWWDAYPRTHQDRYWAMLQRTDKFLRHHLQSQISSYKFLGTVPNMTV